MRFLREIIGGLIVAAVLIAYHSIYPVVRINYTDQRETVICDMQRSEQPPSPWQRGGI